MALKGWFQARGLVLNIIETIHHGHYYNRRVVEVSELSLSGMDELLADSPYNRTVSTDQRVNLLAALKARSAGGIGWATYELGGLG